MLRSLCRPAVSAAIYSGFVMFLKILDVHFDCVGSRNLGGGGECLLRPRTLTLTLSPSLTPTHSLTHSLSLPLSLSLSIWSWQGHGPQATAQPCGAPGAAPPRCQLGRGRWTFQHRAQSMRIAYLEKQQGRADHPNCGVLCYPSAIV